METIEKVNVKKLREDIKSLAEEQKFFKNQRKTVRFSGIRKMEPWEATMKHYHGRKKLSVLYAALLVLRGWTEEHAANAHLSKKDESYTFDSMKDKMKEVLDLYTENA